MELERAIEILKNKNDYIVPSSDFDEAIRVAIEVMEEKINPIVRINNNIKLDKIIDKFLKENEEEK